MKTLLASTAIAILTVTSAVADGHTSSSFVEKMDAQGLTHEAAIVAAGEGGLRDAGLSRQKIRYALALAQAGVDYAALRDAPDAQVIKTLTAIPGVGSWTAQIYAMFSLGRADVFPSGDLALQEAARHALALPGRPDAAALAALAEGWQPWRAVAARALWAYYRHVRGKEGAA